MRSRRTLRLHSVRWTSWAIAIAVALALWAAPATLIGRSRAADPAEAATASLHITADLQGRPPAPAPEWVTPLTVTLEAGEITVWEGSIICDERGAMEIHGLEPISYVVSIRGLNTLTAAEPSPVLGAGINAMHVGPLLAGDLNADERIDIVDFSLFRGSFATDDELGDLNNSGFVDILDFSLLRNNFGRWGPTDAGR